MKIAIEALGIHYYGGGRSATLKLLETLFAIDTQNQYLVFLSQPEPSLMTAAGNIRQYVAPFQNRFALRLWAQANLPSLTRNYDVVHFIKNLGVFGIQPPTVVTMYDLATLVLADLFPKVDVWYWRTIQRHTLHRAARVIAISQNTARDVAAYYQVPCERIDVIYPAHAANFQPVGPAELQRVQQCYALPQDYVVCVARIDRIKNLSSLVRAFAQMKALTAYGGKLVFAGEEYRKNRDSAIYTLIEDLGIQDAVSFTGAVPDQDLPAIFAGAQAAVMPSRYEGFGIVPLEAMACGVPLIVNRAGALGETVGDAAIVLERGDVPSLADALALVVGQPALRQAMRERGLARARQFDRDTAARQTLDVYQRVYREGGQT